MQKAEIRIKRLLHGTGLKLSAAESCTGGMISHLITTVPGSSNYYLGSVTSYDPRIKEEILGVKAETIEAFGIVSSEVASSMARGVRKLTGSDFSVATTGWADSYGDEHEPAGTCWAAIDGPIGTKTFRLSNHESRKANIKAFASSALVILAEYIEQCLTNQESNNKTKLL